MTLYELLVEGREPMSRLEPKGRNPFALVVSVPQAAELKQVAQSAVVRAVQEGRLPAWEVGRMYFMRREDVEAWQPVRGRGRRKPNVPSD